MAEATGLYSRRETAGEYDGDKERRLLRHDLRASG